MDNEFETLEEERERLVKANEEIESVKDLVYRAKVAAVAEKLEESSKVKNALNIVKGLLYQVEYNNLN